MMTPKNIKLALALPALALLMGADGGCNSSSDDIQRRQQERILQEGMAQIGMPAIKNFREKKILKDILELRDQDGLVTYTYVFNELSGQLVFFGETIGYGIPYATQFTNPEKYEYQGITIPQADPNGLFSPASAEGTWILLKDPNGKDVRPVYVEPRIVVSPFRLNTGAVVKANAGEGEDITIKSPSTEKPDAELPSTAPPKKRK